MSNSVLAQKDNVLHVGPKDKCPCGSGRKYKKCCGIGTGPEAALRREENYTLIRRTEAELVPKIFGFAASLGKDLFEDTLSLFLQGMGEELAEDPEEYFDAMHQMLASWLLYDWPALERTRTSAGSFFTPAEFFMKAYGTDPKDCKREFDFHDNEIAFIQAGVSSTFSWYIVEAVNPGMTLLLRDFFTDETIEVYEHTASTASRVGECMLARVLTLYGVNFLFGCFPFTVSPRDIPLLLEARDELPGRVKRLIEESAREQDDEGISERCAQDIVTRTTFAIVALSSRENELQQPILHNTDGDRMEPFELRFVFKRGMEQEARTALLPLLKHVPDLDAKELLEPKAFPVEFPWCKKGNKVHSHWDNTVIAHLRLEEGQLVAAVNSKKRRDKVKRKIQSLLKGLLEKCYSEEIYLEEGMAHYENKIDTSDPALLEEIESQMREHLFQYMESWCTEPIPALEGQTPEQAAKTERGRELLNALFHQYEQFSEKIDDPLAFTPDVSELKARLGLADEQH